MAAAPGASAGSAAGPADVAAVVESVFAPGAGRDLPGAAVVVLRDGSVVHAKAYGLASVELGVPNTTATRFRLASVTKSFTALALLQLAEQGRVSLDDPLEKHVPGFAGGDRILLRHVLSHTAGLPDFVSVEEARKVPPDGAPGERLNYSNVGYSVLGRVIEKVTGRTYEEHLREAILAPLGMAGSGVDRRAQVTKGRACGYLFLPEGGIVNAEHTDTAADPGAGGLSSTAEDMGRWASALLAGRIVSRETLERATTPVTLTGGRLGAYGQGFMTIPYRGLREFGHGGDISGFNSYVAFYPDERLAVIVLSNVGMRPPGPVPTAGDVAHRIVAGLVGSGRSGRLSSRWPRRRSRATPGATGSSPLPPSRRSWESTSTSPSKADASSRRPSRAGSRSSRSPRRPSSGRTARPGSRSCPRRLRWKGSSASWGCGSTG
jgi:CubicO group peptidase (beta-lactamase class C family)